MRTSPLCTFITTTTSHLLEGGEGGRLQGAPGHVATSRLREDALRAGPTAALGHETACNQINGADLK